MEPVISVALLWALFAAIHIGLATRRIRAALVARLGEIGFGLVYSLIASVTYAVAIATYAAHRFEGPPGLALGAVPSLRWVLMGVVFVSIALMAGGLVSVPGSPYDPVSPNKRTRPPQGMERITRHPFFAGLALFNLAHILLATRLVSATFFAGVALLSIVGPMHQDRKLLGRLGRPYADYLAVTSAIPFGAVLSGRQQLVWSELPLGALAMGVVVGLALRWVHDGIFDYGGAFVIGGTIGGAALVGVLSAWRAARASRRRRAQPAGATV